jgi:glycosyltransferase involved in cell wall biosynthesis
MTDPLLSIIIPSIGRPGLRSTVASIEQQADKACCEVLIVADTHSGPIDGLESYVSSLGPRYRYLEHDGGLHMVGHPQRNYGMTQARGAFLHFMADDDIYAPRALRFMLAAIDEQDEPMPILFRVDTWQAGVVWRVRELVEGNIDAECIVVPNVPSRLGVWTPRYPGDFDFIEETVNRWGGAQWEREIISLCRPTRSKDWTRDMAEVSA